MKVLAILSVAIFAAVAVATPEKDSTTHLVCIYCPGSR